MNKDKDKVDQFRKGLGMDEGTGHTPVEAVTHALFSSPHDLSFSHDAYQDQQLQPDRSEADTG
jgi:hypothetical protein